MRDLVLLHGFTATGASWRPVAERVAERYRVLAPDLRGHGTASEARPVTFAAVLGDLAALPPRAFTLGGYSMGGRVALAFALAYPERVERLVLIGASPGIADEGERAERRRADERLAAELEAAARGSGAAASPGGAPPGAERVALDTFARRWAAQPLFAGQPRAVAAAAHADRMHNTPAGLAAALRGLGTGGMEPLWDRLPALDVPVDLLAGERDAKFHVIAEQMAARLPHARVHVVAGAGHAAHLERPDAVAEVPLDS